MFHEYPYNQKPFSESKGMCLQKEKKTDKEEEKCREEEDLNHGLQHSNS